MRHETVTMHPVLQALCHIQYIGRVSRAFVAVEAVSKLELQDTQGNWSTVWSGLSDVKADARGSRTWFVRSFDKTPTQVKSVKVTIANNVERGYKEVDAAQLVGE